MTQNNLKHIFALSVTLLLGISFVLAPQLVFAEIETDKSVYSKGEPVRISGILDFQDYEQVNIVEIEIVNSNNDNTIVNEYTPVGDDGSFSRSYDSAIWQSGEYRVTVSYNDVEEMTEFEVSDSSSSNDDSDNTIQQQESSSSSSNDIPDRPTNLSANPISSTQIDLSWSAPHNEDGNSVAITGYKIETRTANTASYSTVVDNTASADTVYSHTDLTPGTTYIYRVSAINDIGTSDPSSEDIARTLSAESEDNENTDLSIVESSSNTASELESYEQPSASLDESDITASYIELENQNIVLQSANLQLSEENDQLKVQIEELSNRIDQLDAIIKEQIRVIMETLTMLRSGN